MREFTVLKDLVEYTEENEILAYITQSVVVDVVENFFMKTFTESQLLDYPLNILENSIKRMYINSYPEAIDDEVLLKGFADDVIFYLCAKLAKQEIIRQVDGVFVYSHIIKIYSSFQVPEGEEDKLIHSFVLQAKTEDRVTKYVNEWIKENVLPNILRYVYWEIQG
jgi:hypothetical protein